MASYPHPSYTLQEHGEQEQSLMVKLVQVAVEAEVRQVERMARQVELIAGKVELEKLGVPSQREDSDRISVVEQQH